jgi:protein phosphatase
MDVVERCAMTEDVAHETSASVSRNSFFEVEVAAVTDIGQHRTNNEDCFGYDLNTHLFIVCDGMGGVAGGEVASRLAVDRAIKVYGQLDGSPMKSEERLNAAISAANYSVWSVAKETPQLAGMGTTMVAASIVDNNIVIGNVGDSRAYFLRGDACVQITEDHAMQGPHIREGKAISGQYITRAIGAERSVCADYYVADLRSGDIILLATDGLTRYTDAERISLNIRELSSLEATCRSLIAVAHQGGAVDNVTCLLIRIR